MDKSRLPRSPGGCLLAVLLAVLLVTPTVRAQSPESDSGMIPASVERFRDAFVSTEAFRQLWKRSFEGRTGRNPLKVELLEARITDALAVVRADYGPESRDPAGQYVWVLERHGDGPWVLAWWIFNRKPETG